MKRVQRLLLVSGLALVLGASGPAAPAPSTWAVVVGINDYINFGDEIGGDLRGAVNDALAMRDVLVARHGVPSDNILMLLDHDATREAIKAALTEWLPSVVRPGDLVIFYFAGHGSRTWNLDGTEPDGLDETICPADVRRESPDQDIRDKELGAWLGALNTHRIVAILDSCHSGTATREVTPFARPRTLGRETERDIPRPRNIPVATPVPEGQRPGDRVLEIAAARADEVAVDAAWPREGGDLTWSGAFTTNFVRNLWQLPVGTSYEVLFDATVRDMRRQRFAQNPMLTPGIDYPVDGAALSVLLEQPTDVPAGDAVLTLRTAVSDGRVELVGGTRAGITVGSYYSVGPAVLRIEDVLPDRALARVLAEDVPEGLLIAGAEARLVAYRYPEAVLRVGIAGLSAGTRVAIRRALRDKPGIALQDDATSFAHLLVRPHGEGYAIIGMDGAVRHEVETLDVDLAVADLAPLLLQEYGALTLAELENPVRPFRLELGFQGGVRSFELGTTIEFRVRTEREGYLTLVDLGTDGTVTVIFPNAWEENNFVSAGQDVVLPSPAMIRDDVVFEAQPPVGRGIVRAFLTRDPLPLSDLGQGVEAAAGVRAALRSVLAEVPGVPALDGEAFPVESWATSAVLYEIIP